jgi:hypothetical protein
MLSLPPDAPLSLRPLLSALIETARAARAPGGPVRLHVCLAAQLPAPGDWPGGLLFVSDLRTLAVSDGAAWVRQDTGEVI